MMTVNEVSKLAGVSARTLHYYNKIGLLQPSGRTEAGYRLYDDTALERLQQILLFRELEFPLKDIKEILDGKDFDRNRALEQQIELLTLKKEHLENLITFARGIYGTGVKNMDFTAFDTKKSTNTAGRPRNSGEPQRRTISMRKRAWAAARRMRKPLQKGYGSSLQSSAG